MTDIWTPTRWRAPKFFYSPKWYSQYVPWLPQVNTVQDLRGLLAHHFIKCDYRNEPWFETLVLKGHSLELGFNSGKTCYWMCRRYPELTIDLVDWNPKLMKLVPMLKEIVPGIREVHFGEVPGVLQALEPHSYQNIFSFDFFEHLPHHVYRETLPIISDLLASDGRFFVYFGQGKMPEHVNLMEPDRIRETLTEVFNVTSLLTDKGKSTMFIADPLCQASSFTPTDSATSSC